MGAAQARALVEAKLGRPAQDSLEASVVLEAWGGLSGSTRFELGEAVIGVASPERPPARPTDSISWAVAEKVSGHGLGLVLALSAIVAWTIPLAATLGSPVVRDAGRVALPVTVTLQWLLMRRYLSGTEGVGRLRNAYRSFGLLLLLGVLAAACAAQHGRLLASSLLFVWVSGLVLVRRGWGAVYGVLVMAAAGGLWVGAPPRAVVPGLVAVIGGGLVVALKTTPSSDRIATSWQRSLPAGLIGAGMGVLLLLVTEKTWTGSSMVPLLALLPSLLGSMWAGQCLQRLWTDVPGSLRTRSIRESSSSESLRLAGPILLGALGRAVAGTGALSFVVIVVALKSGQPTRGLAGVLAALGGAAVVGVVASVLEAFQRPGWAIAVVAAADVAAWTSLHYGGANLGTLTFVPPAVALLVATRPLGRLVADIEMTLACAGI